MLITAESISKSFGNKKDENLQIVLKDLDFSMNAGESVAIFGTSGSGKTTFLNILGSLENPDYGKVLFEGKNITDLKLKEIEHFRNRQIGFIFQFHHLLPQCSLLENVLIPTLPLKNKERKQKIELAEDLLKRVGIWEHRNKRPAKLSGGQCQRVAVVRAMINQPKLILADEPTGALDRENADVIGDLLTELNLKDGVSLLVVTHSEKLASKMNTIYQIKDGKLINILV
jgi:ABC-type lipoprotein export system ATPase subunit